MALEVGLPTLFREHLRAEPDLLPRGSRVVVAFSGGADSTALLHLLRELTDDLELRLIAAHFDHTVRQDSSSDAVRAGRVAASLGLPFHLGRPSKPPAITQADLRRARHEWLSELAAGEDADRIALAHQADDQAETVLFRVMRGTGMEGLAGIPARRGLIARPLLPFRRADLRSYLDDRGMPWVDDPSNRDRRWARARIRHEVIPVLEARAGDTVDRLLALSRAAGVARELTGQMAGLVLARAESAGGSSGRVELDATVLQAAGGELTAAVVRRVARRRGVELTRGGTRAAVEFMRRGRSGSYVTIGSGLRVMREFDRIVLTGEPDPALSGEVVVHPMRGEGRMRIGDRTLSVRWRPILRHRGSSDCIAVAVSPGHYPLMFRGWRCGDRIRLPGGTRKLKKWFGDRRVPVSERVRRPVLADRSGNVLWVEGLGAAVGVDRAGETHSMLEFDLRYE